LLSVDLHKKYITNRFVYIEVMEKYKYMYLLVFLICGLLISECFMMLYKLVKHKEIKRVHTFLIKHFYCISQNHCSYIYDIHLFNQHIRIWKIYSVDLLYINKNERTLNTIRNYVNQDLIKHYYGNAHW